MSVCSAGSIVAFSICCMPVPPLLLPIGFELYFCCHDNLVELGNELGCLVVTMMCDVLP